MTAEELEAMLAHLGMGVNDLARACGCERRTAARWLSGENPVASAAETVLALMLEFNLNPANVIKIREAFREVTIKETAAFEARAAQSGEGSFPDTTHGN